MRHPTKRVLPPSRPALGCGCPVEVTYAASEEELLIENLLEMAT